MKIVDDITLDELREMAKKKKKFQHKTLAEGRWKKFTFFEQMANMGSEVERAISWKEKNNEDYSRRAFWRALELLDLTIEFCEKKERFKELTRLREALVDYFFGKNEFRSSSLIWHKYFFPFNFAAKL